MLTLAVIFLVVSLVVDAIVSISLIKTYKPTIRLLVLVSIFLIFATNIAVISYSLNFYTYIIILISVFRIINILRVAKHRMHHRELFTRFWQSSVFFGLLTILFGMLYIDFATNGLSVNLVLIAYIQLAVSSLLFLSVFVGRSLFRYRAKLTLPERLPTVSICIPARNETEDLPKCIESVLSSTYSKLEILVLDDCSHDRTPELIKQYAHSGVRFIKGEAPSDNWLPKNLAYDRLADEAKGDVLIFIGVDVRFNSETVSKLVAQLGNFSMISILPKRSKEKEGSIFIQPLRYWWELGLWRFNMYSPPVLSSCWAVKGADFKDVGGFDSLRKAVEPEANLARKFSKHGKYSFLVSNQVVGVESAKTAKEQFNTGLRTRYIQLRKRPELVFSVLFFEMYFIFGSYVLLTWSIYTNSIELASLAIVSVLILSVTNIEVYRLALRKLWIIGVFALPFLIVADWFLMLKSMYGYEFGKIVWKDRNICIPLLKVEKELPKL